MSSLALGISVGVAFLVLIVVAIRRRALRDQMAVLWLTVSIVMLVLGLSLPTHLLDHLAHAVGVAYGSDLVFGAAVVFLVVLVLQLSVAVARLYARTTRLAQEVGLLQMRQEDLEERAGTPPTP